MTRKEHLEFCSVCTHRSFDPKQGIICGITNSIADFDPACETYQADETALASTKQTLSSVPAEGGTFKINEEQLAHFRLEQNLNFAIITGILTSLIGAIIWAAVTVATQVQIGYMAVGIGVLVGLGIRYTGKGIDPIYSYLGAGFALFSCLFGNFLSVLGFGAAELGITWIQVLDQVEFSLLLEVMADNFHPMDLLFYSIAVYEGYKFAPRTFDAADLLIETKSEN